MVKEELKAYLFDINDEATVIIAVSIEEAKSKAEALSKDCKPVYSKGLLVLY